jgi:hypothetical protein
MSLVTNKTDAVCGPWNPGVESQVPRHLRPLATIFRQENVFTDFATAEELRDLTGLELTELVAFRPQRLALHELLIRVTADISVPDGSAIGDLGINFRQIVSDIHSKHIEPQMIAITARYDEVRRQIAAMVEAELGALLSGPSTRTTDPKRAKGWLSELFGRGPATPPVEENSIPEQSVVARWEAQAHVEKDERRAAVYGALARVVSALVIRHGGVWGSRPLLASLATDIACNKYGSDEIGRLIDPWIRKAAADEPYRLLPRQEEPVVMNTKGPSASGKSSLRPLQKRLAGQIGVNWTDFALISPDIWRKQLLDYGTLGDDYKYGGAFTGDEVQIIDHKLDRYMARKAGHEDISHLLIDRFRFDSFAPDSNEAGSNLLTRFGHIVYLFFMITPPASLVERAWARGLEFGRYKAVDDTLAHSIEAYAGMPQLFFTWVKRADKRVHFEFLDNSVPLGERPRTIAFGWNDELNVLDVKCILDVERYRRVNVDATSPELIYGDVDQLAPEQNARFLRQCVEQFRVVNFADQASGRVYLHVVSGSPAWVDREALHEALNNSDTRAGLLEVAPAAVGGDIPAPEGPTYLRALSGAERNNTLGAWGFVKR